MKKVILALLALIMLIMVIGCPPKGDPDDAFGPGPDREIANGDETPEAPAVDPDDDADNEIDSETTESLNGSPNNSLPNIYYEIVEAEDLSLGLIKRFVYRVVVNPTIQEDQVKPLIDSIIQAKSTADPDIDEMGRFIYSDRQIIHGVYDVAKADWAPGGRWGSTNTEVATSNNRDGYSISITIKDDLENYLQNRNSDETKFGFTEQERRQIFLDTTRAQNRANDEAEARYPYDFLAWGELWQKLLEKYELEVCVKYGITPDTQQKILAEGLDKNWPAARR